MIARIRLFIRQRKCRKVGHAWKCLHCYEPEMRGEVMALNLKTGEAETVQLIEQKHKQACAHCGTLRLETTVRFQPMKDFDL